MTHKNYWQVDFALGASKIKKKLPLKIQIQLDLLAKEMEIEGPIQKEWSHFSPLKKNKIIPEASYHCHIKSGRPTYVVCWRIRDKTVKLIEIFYVGTHENAPY